MKAVCVADFKADLLFFFRKPWIVCNEMKVC